MKSNMLSIILYYKSFIFATYKLIHIIMKKIIYTLFAVSILFTACKKEEGCMDTIATNYNPDAELDEGNCTYGIVGGSWITNSEVVDIHMVATMGGMVVMDSTWTETETNKDSMETVTLKFSDNGDFNAWDNNNNLVDNGTWVQSGTTITVTTDTVMVGEIISVTKTNLVHKVVGSQIINDMGIDFDIDFVFTADHTRDENGFTFNNASKRVGENQSSIISKKKIKNIVKNIKK